MRNGKQCFTLVFFVLCCLLMSPAASLFAADLPFITTADLKSKMDKGEDLLLINALSSIEHKEVAIKGSINIPASKVKAGNSLLPADKGKLLVFYCKGPKCGKSRIAAGKAKKLGYTNVIVYNEGLPAWAKKGYPLDKQIKYPKISITKLKPQDVQAQLDSIVLLDIRGKKHRKMGTIDGTVNILLDDMEEKYTTLPKGKKIVVMDHAGKQTSITAKFLHMNGYTDVAVMNGGMSSWLRAGLPAAK